MRVCYISTALPSNFDALSRAHAACFVLVPIISLIISSVLNKGYLKLFISLVLI